MAPSFELQATTLKDADLEHPDAVAMVRRASEVLGISHFAAWMQSEIPSLGNQTPLALLSTGEGRAQVERVLQKIEHGVY